ncbi:hypothetical protein [Massilia aerilata]|uniref:Uncharacterized protein n=1 Tax=Massilia aerilata TaxID=453817 RepID=A0ABW0RTZ9_9BURK
MATAKQLRATIVEIADSVSQDQNAPSGVRAIAFAARLAGSMVSLGYADADAALMRMLGMTASVTGKPVDGA